MSAEFNRLKELSEKYSAPVPRYTSYPTAVELGHSTDTSVVASALSAKNSDERGLSLYLHYPYCKNLCYFCACNKTIRDGIEVRSAYLKLIKKECQMIEAAAGRKLSVVQVHLGGGSPSLLEPVNIDELNEILGAHFQIRNNCPKSIEVDPRTFDRNKADCLVKHGYRRASVGVQDFDAHVQQAVNRVQPYELTKTTLEYLKEAGFTNLNVDLIYGLPEQTLESFQNTLQHVCELRPDRIALYGYAHVNWKVKVQNVFRNFRLPTPLERLQLFDHGVRAFTEAGYHYIGLDHFSLPDDELYQAFLRGTLRRNFMGYTVNPGDGILGIGQSSLSDISGLLYQNYAEEPPYRNAIEAGMLPIYRMLQRTREDQIRASIIERLMSDGKIEKNTLLQRFPTNVEISEIFAAGVEKLTPYLEDELVTANADTITLTPLGRFFSRNIASVFDTYLEKHQQKEKPTFSQAI